MQDRRAHLEELAILPVVLEGRAAAAKHRHVAAGPAAALDTRSGAAFVGQLGPADSSRHFDAVPVGSVFDRDIPHIVFAVGRRHAEAGPGWAIIAEGVLRIAVAVCTETTAR